MTENPMPPPPPFPPKRPAVGSVIAITMILAGIAAAFVINTKRQTTAEGAKKIIETRRAEDLPYIKDGVADFTLTERSGKQVSLKDLLGRVWVADFFFTNCRGVCPKMSQNFSDLHREFPGKDEPKFVSFTADPENDTLPVLNDYARMNQADGDRWWFLTGDEKTLHDVANSMALPYEIGKPASHSNRFVLVDRDGQVRGAYVGVTDDEIQKLRFDLSMLLDAPKKKQ